MRSPLSSNDSRIPGGRSIDAALADVGMCLHRCRRDTVGPGGRRAARAKKAVWLVSFSVRVTIEEQLEPTICSQSTFIRGCQLLQREVLETAAQVKRCFHVSVYSIQLHFAEAFAAEKAELQSLPAVPFDELLRLERRVSHDGLVSIGGNYYSVPDRTRRVVEVHQLPDQIRILDQGRLVATHPVLEGRRQYRIDPAHRHAAHTRMPRQATEDLIIGRIGERVPHRSLAVYQAIGERLALAGGRS
jgi:hypothetical protein